MTLMREEIFGFRRRVIEIEDGLLNSAATGSPGTLRSPAFSSTWPALPGANGSPRGVVGDYGLTRSSWVLALCRRLSARPGKGGRQHDELDTGGAVGMTATTRHAAQAKFRVLSRKVPFAVQRRGATPPPATFSIGYPPLCPANRRPSAMTGHPHLAVDASATSTWKGPPRVIEQTAPTRPSSRTAHLITEALSPAVLVAGISVVVAWYSGRSLAWGLIAATFASLIPLAYVLRGVRRRHYDDHHVRPRERRPAVLLFAAASVLAGLALMVLFHAPRELIALVVAMLAGLALTLIVTYWWTKVSFHTAVAAGTATVLTLVFGSWLLLSWLVVIAVAWSRVRLGDHTVAQTLIGAVLGTIAVGLASRWCAECVQQVPPTAAGGTRPGCPLWR